MTRATAARIEAAKAKQAEARRIIARVAAVHIVSVNALAGAHPSRMKHHVVMARCQAAHAMREAGFTWKEIAGFLGMKGHSLAIRSARIWREHLEEKA